MSAEEDLKRYQRDQELFFQQLEEQQRETQERIALRDLARTLERAGIDLDPFHALKRQLQKLGKLSGMSVSDAEEWATSLIAEGIRLRLQQVGNKP